MITFYVLGVQSNTEGTLWRDPPDYWEQIVYPAYVNAHSGLFESGDVESGQPRAADFTLLEGTQTDIDGLVQRSCKALVGYIEHHYS